MRRVYVVTCWEVKESKKSTYGRDRHIIVQRFTNEPNHTSALYRSSIQSYCGIDTTSRNSFYWRVIPPEAGWTGNVHQNTMGQEDGWQNVNN